MAQGSGFSSRRALPLPVTGNLRDPVIRSGAGGAAATAGMLGQVSRRLSLLGGHLVDQDMERQLQEEERAGGQAGMASAASGEALEARDSGFFGRREDDAFNRAAEVGYAQGLQVRIEQQRQQLELDHEGDPDGFMKAWDAFQSETLQRTPQGLRQGIGLVLQQHGNRGDFRLAGQKRERVASQAALNVRLRSDQLTTLAANAAREGGNPAAAAEQLGELTSSVQQAVAAGWLADDEAAALLLRARNDTFEAAYLGAFERAPSMASLEDFLTDDTPELDPATKDRLAGRMQAVLARRESAFKAAHAELGRDVAQVRKALNAGLEVEGLDELRRRAAGTEYEVELDVAAAVADQVRSLSQLGPAEVNQRLQGIRAEIEEVRKSPVPVEAAEQAAGVVGQLEDLETAASERMAFLEAGEQALRESHQRTLDMIGKGQAIDRAAELGLVEPAPLDFSSADALGDSLDARLEAAEQVEAHFGVAPGNVLTAPEVQGFTELLNAGAAQTETQAAVLATMTERLGRERMGAVLEQVAKDAPAMAFAGGAPPALMNQMLRGRAILAENPKIAPGADQQAVRDIVSEVYGGVLGESPATLRQAQEAARWLYASRRFAEGDLSGTLDDDTFKQALRDAVGGVVTYEHDGSGMFGDNMSTVIPPRPGMTSDEFTALIDGLGDRDLAAAGPRPVTAEGQPVNADLIRRLGGLRSIGDGVYAVTVGGFGLLDQSGQPYVLDLGAVLRSRRSGPTLAAPSSILHLGTGEVTPAPETVLLGTGERIPAGGG